MKPKWTRGSAAILAKLKHGLLAKTVLKHPSAVQASAVNDKTCNLDENQNQTRVVEFEFDRKVIAYKTVLCTLYGRVLHWLRLMHITSTSKECQLTMIGESYWKPIYKFCVGKMFAHTSSFTAAVHPAISLAKVHLSAGTWIRQCFWDNFHQLVGYSGGHQGKIYYIYAVYPKTRVKTQQVVYEHNVSLCCC